MSQRFIVVMALVQLLQLHNTLPLGVLMTISMYGNNNINLGRAVLETCHEMRKMEGMCWV